MPNKMELLLEAERRGTLPADMAGLLSEARRRGLTGEQQPEKPQFQSGPQSRPEDKPNAPGAEYVRPLLETGGAAAGALIGGAAGGIAGAGGGPAAPATIPYGLTAGGVAGGGLGYAAGSGLADIYETAFGTKKAKGYLGEAVDALADVGTGMVYEMAPAAIAPLARGAVAAVKFARRPIQGSRNIVQNLIRGSAGKTLAESRSPAGSGVAREAARNMEEAAGVENRVGGGLSFGRGQASGDPVTLALQRGMQTNKEAQSLIAEQELTNNAALRDYITKSLPKNGTVDHVLAAISDYEKGVSNQASRAAANAERIGAGMTATPQEVSGGALRSQAEGVKATLGRAKDELYDAVPKDTKIDSAPIYDKIQQLGAEFSPAFERLSSFPGSILTRAGSALKPGASGPGHGLLGPPKSKDISFGDLQKFRSQVLESLRAARATGDAKATLPLAELRTAIDDTLKLAETQGKGEGVDALRAANKFYRETYVPTVRQGATKRALGVDKDAQLRVPDAMVGREYLKPGPQGIAAAESFNRTFGKDPVAVQAIKDYSAQDLLRAATNPSTGEISSANMAKWLAQHKESLNRLGIGDHFKSLDDAAKMADRAKEVKLTFDKSELSKALNGADPDKAMKVIFSGKGVTDSGRQAQRLLNIVGKNEMARNGLKRAFADHIMDINKSATLDVAGGAGLKPDQLKQTMNRLMPAMRKIYSKAELNALSDVQKAIEIGARINKPTSGVAGSQTAFTAVDIASRAAPLNSKFKILHAAFRHLGVGYRSEVDGYLARAMYDPNLAHELMQTSAAVKQFRAQEIARLAKELGSESTATAISNVRIRADKEAGRRAEAMLKRHIDRAISTGLILGTQPLQDVMVDKK